jgi:hypothetical protein
MHVAGSRLDMHYVACIKGCLPTLSVTPELVGVGAVVEASSLPPLA